MDEKFICFMQVLVVHEVPEARLSVNDKTTDTDEVYFNTKHDCTVYTYYLALTFRCLIHWMS